MKRLLLPTCIVLSLIAFVHTFQTEPPPNTREIVEKQGFTLRAGESVNIDVIIATCRADAPEDGVEPSKCIVTEPGTSKPPSNEDWRRWLEEKPGSVTVTRIAP